MARQSHETRLLREAAYCIQANRPLPVGLAAELKSRNLLQGQHVHNEVTNIIKEVYHNGYGT